MRDVILVTADSVRHDYASAMDFVSSFDVRPGVTAAHYTRPSLASLQSSSLLAAIRSKPVRPNLAEVLAEAGYTTIGLVPSPQADPAFDFDAGFDEYDNFTEGSGNALKNRRSRLREFLGGFELVRRVYRRVSPMEAVLDGLPSDEELVDRALELFADASAPRFLWIHLMGTHRPYGTGEDAVPKSLDRKAGALGSGGPFGTDDLSTEERDLIDRKYRDALGRADREIERLVREVDSDPLFVFTSDHGEELGEEGYYYHQGYRRRVPDTILTVPAAFGGIDVPEGRLSLLDVGPTIAGAVGVDAPAAWHGNDLRRTTPEQLLTVAPWHDRATVVWQDGDRKLIARDADVSFEGEDEDRTGRVERAAVSDDLEERLQNLGYVDAG